MVEKSQEYLRLAIAAAVLLIGLSVAYHYVIYIPKRDHEKELDAQAKADADAKLLQAKDDAYKKLAQDRQTSYKICLSNAQANYDQRWNGSCKTLSDEADKNRTQCVKSGGTEEGCENSFPFRPANGCELPSAMSSTYDAGLKDSQDRCLDEAKSGVASP
jgi:hypothetical protein